MVTSENFFKKPWLVPDPRGICCLCMGKTGSGQLSDMFNVTAIVTYKTPN